MRTYFLMCSMMCRLWFKYWPGSVISIISFGHMGFLLPDAIINPHFITTSSCIFHFHSVHLPHFTHFRLFWTPHLKFCLPLPTEHYFFDSSLVPACHVCTRHTAPPFISISALNPCSQTFPSSLFPLKGCWLTVAIYGQHARLSLRWSRTASG